MFGSLIAKETKKIITQIFVDYKRFQIFMTSLFCDKKETDLTGSYTDYRHNSHAKVPPVNVGGAIRGVFFIGSNKGIALSEIYGRYLILVKFYAVIVDCHHS